MVLAVRIYVACTSLLAVAAVAALAVVDPRLERLWLTGAFAALIALEHLFETRLVRRGEQGESYSHEESFLAAMALLASPISVVAAFGAGFLAGNVLMRRHPMKAVFNVAIMVLASACALLVVEAAGGASTEPRGAAAVLAGALVFAVVNRVALAGVFALAGAGPVRESLFDDVRGRALVWSGDVSIGLLAGFAGSAYPWTLPFGLAAMVALHFALAGHVRARAERQKLGDIVASSSDGIVSVDPRGRVISWNPASERITGYAAERVLGCELDALAELLDADAGAFARVGDDEVHAVRVRSAAGETRWLAISRAPLPEGGSVIVLRDETTRRQVEEILAREDRERLKSDLVATVSHELRTPLTSILGFTKTLLRGRADEREQRLYLEIIEKQGERLKSLIDDLLDARQISEGGLALDRAPVDVGELVAEQVDVFARQSEAHVVVAEVPPDPLWVDADRDRLGQVLSNLLSNAVKYSPDGGEVSVAAAAVDGAVRVSVTDSGLGIPADQQPQIFRRFFRADSSASRAVGGTGLGLALSREIVEAHGGRIGFESAEGEGSTFYFELPKA